MATTEERLKYFIEAVWAGKPETSQASKDIRATGDAYKSARQSLIGLQGTMQGAAGAYSQQAALQNKIALAMAQAEKAALRLAQAQETLEKNVNPEKQEQLAMAALRAQVAFDRKGASVDKLTRQLDALNREEAETVGGFKATTDAATTGATGAEAFAGKLLTIGTSAVTVTAALAAAKKVFDLSQEGAKLNDVTTSFKRMNEEVYQTPDLLERMRQATRNTVTDVTLMQGLLTLTAGTTNDVARAFADAAPDLLEIAKAANKLNPTLGDTSFLYESLATGIKRGSPAILDNLGILVRLEDAYRKYADTLGISTSALTGEQKTLALLNAVREKGRILIQQVGGDVAAESDAWAILTTKIENTTNAWKQHLAEGVLPVIRALSGEYQEIRQREIELAQASGDLNAITADNVQGLIFITQRLATTARNYEDYEKAVRNLNSEQQTEIIARQMLTREYYAQARAQGEYNQRTERAIELDRERAAGAAELATLTAQTIQQQAQAAREAWGDYIEPAIRARQELSETRAMAAALAEGMIPESERLRLEAFVDIMNTRAIPGLDNYIKAIEDVEAAQGEWLRGAVDNSQKIAEINEQLGQDLSDDTKKAYQEMLRTVDEGSDEWLHLYQALQGDLTESQRNELIARRADLQAHQGDFYDYYTGNAKAAEDASARIVAAQDEMIQAILDEQFARMLATTAQREGEEAAIRLAVQMGIMTQQEADARLQFLAMRDAAEEVNRRFEEGALTAEAARRALETYLDLIAGRIQLFYDAATAAAAFKDQLREIENIPTPSGWGNPFGGPSGSGNDDPDAVPDDRQPPQSPRQAPQPPQAPLLITPVNNVAAPTGAFTSSGGGDTFIFQVPDQATAHVMAQVVSQTRRAERRGNMRRV